MNRDEFAGLFKTKPTPAQLVEDALGSFQKAQEQMASAQDAIKAEQAVHVKAADCQGHYERLARVSNRLTDLLA
jgi:hypothetical protein